MHVLTESEYSPHLHFYQYLLMAVLPRQHIRKLDIVVPFFGPATMERVDKVHG